MAKIKGGLFSLDAVGSIANLLSFQSGSSGGRVIRKPRTPTNAPQANRDKYAAACVAWNLLTTEERSTWNNLAAPLKLTGFNLFVRDQMITPPVVRTYATLDPNKKHANALLSNGDLHLAVTTNTTYARILATQGLTSGKWSWETKITSSGTVLNFLNGITNSYSTLLSNWLGQVTTTDLAYGQAGIVRGMHSLNSLAALALNDVLTLALDLDNLTLSFYKNGSLITTQTITSGSTFWPAASAQLLPGADYNFGQSPLAYPVSGFNEGVYTES
jgi:hypothetical protein